MGYRKKQKYKRIELDSQYDTQNKSSGFRRHTKLLKKLRLHRNTQYAKFVFLHSGTAQYGTGPRKELEEVKIHSKTK